MTATRERRGLARRAQLGDKLEIAEGFTRHRKAAIDAGFQGVNTIDQHADMSLPSGKALGKLGSVDRFVIFVAETDFFVDEIQHGIGPIRQFGMPAQIDFSTGPFAHLPRPVHLVGERGDKGRAVARCRTVACPRERGALGILTRR